MPTKKGKSTDSESSSLAGVLEMLQEQNRSMQEQHKAQQKMLLEMIEKQRVAHEQEMRALKDGRKEGTEDSSKVKLPKPTLQKLASTDNVEHFLATFERIATQQKWPKEVWATQVAGLLTGKACCSHPRRCSYIRKSEGGNIEKVRNQRRDLSPAIQAG